MRFLEKRHVSILLLPLVFLAFSVSCGHDFLARPSARFMFAYVQNDCGPTDAFALTFYFPVKESKCGKYEEPFILISIIENLPTSAPLEYSIGSRGQGLGSRCLRHGQCEAATSGTLHLSKFSQGKSASGEYELHFQGGSVERGSFDAVWCVTRPICG